jgi:hypothetical protein
VSYDLISKLLTFNFEMPPSDGSCFIYLFDENNGVPFEIALCERWEVSAVILGGYLRKFGYSIENVKLAIWQGSKDHLVTSRAYSLKHLLEKNNINIQILPNE